MREPDPFDPLREDQEDSDENVICRQCGMAGLYWIHGLPTADGMRVRSLLYEDGPTGRPMRHACKPSADEFEDLTQE